MEDRIRRTKKGWKEFNGTWYYFDNDGQVKTGWLNYRGTWYYLNDDGSMAHDVVIDGCRINSNGVWLGNLESIDEIMLPAYDEEYKERRN